MLSVCKASISSKQTKLSNLIRYVGKNLSAANASTDSKASKERVKDSTSFCMNLFRGRIATETVFPFPLNLDNERRETLQMILTPTEKFLTEVNNVFKNDETANTPKEVLAQFAELGAFGAVVPEEYEGAGLNNTQMARLAELVGANDLGLGVIMGAHQSIGYKGILLYGTDAQKRKYLPDVATGRKFAAFCLTEPSSGSDANSICTSAVKSDCGKFYTLNGGKIWISNGGFAEVFTVFAQTNVKQPDGTKKQKVSAFIVERGFGGVTNGAPEKKMGIKGSNTAEVHFDNVKVPAENLLGEEGEGFKVAMNILNNGRFGIPAACTGAMKYCIQKTVDHINTRVQFGKKLREYGNVQEKLADMITRHYVTESIVYMLASNMDRGVQDYQLEAAIGKVVASENAWQVCDEAIQLHGGMGFMRECGLERVLRDLRIFRIFEGANDVMRLFVALTGMQVHSSFKENAMELTKAIQEFGAVAEQLLLKHRREIIDRQYELVRMANAAIEIYSMIAVLSRATYALNKDAEAAKHDQQIAQLFLHQATKRALANIAEARHPSTTNTRLIERLAIDVCDNGSLIQKHPIDV